MIANPFSGLTRRVIFQQRGTVRPADISPDGSQILLQHYFSNRDSELHLLATESGAASQIAQTTQLVMYDDAQFARDGLSVLAISDRDSNNRRLIEFDITSQRMRVLTPGLRWDVERYAVSDDNSLLAYSINEDGISRLVVRDFVTNQELIQPQLPRGVITGLDFSPDSGQLAISMTSTRSAGDIWVWDVQNSELIQWTRPELGLLNPYRLAEPQLIRFDSIEGISIPALIYRPRGLPDAQPTPVIIDIHGEQEMQSRPGWNSRAQYFADVLGATVIRPNIRGSDGHGTRYRNLNNGPLREDSVLDIGALLDWIGEQPGIGCNSCGGPWPIRWRLCSACGNDFLFGTSCGWHR